MNARNNFYAVSAWIAIVAVVGPFAEWARAEVVGNWDFSSGSLAGSAGSQVRLRHAPSTQAYATYRATYNAFYAPTFGGLLDVPGITFNTTAAFGIQSLGGAGRTVLRMPDARGAGHLTGLVADFDRADPGKVNGYSVIMDVLIPQTTFDQPNRYVSLFQPRANADGLLFVDTNNNSFGAGTAYKPGFLPDVWQRVALVIDLQSPAYRTYLNGVAKENSPNPGAGRVMDVNGPLSIGSLTDSNYPLGYPLLNDVPDASKTTLFFFNDDIDRNGQDLGTLYVANLQFRDGAMSADEIAALGGPSAGAIPMGGIIAVPEPASMVIVCSALLCLGGAAWRRQRMASRRQGCRNRACG